MRILVLAWIAVGAPAFAQDPAKPAPNVLIICGDDHAPYVIGAYGNTQVRTPNIDGIAAAGMRFERAYANSPVCTASRQSFLTGRYPRTIGVTQLRTPLPESEVTLAEILQEHGYRTAAIGKMHFNSGLKHGFDLRVDTPDHAAWLKERGVKPLAGQDVLPEWKPFRDPARVWLNADTLPYALRDADMAGTWFAREAASYIEQAGDKPFFLMVSFTEPHSPFHFPVEYAGRFSAADFTAPEEGPDDAWQVPAIFEGLTDEHKAGIAASYYTSVEFLDKNVGIVLDALEASGKLDETMVIYLGDHGYMLGQHGRFEKHCSYEPAVRAPLIIRPPSLRGEGVRGRVSHALVELVDLAPTIVDFCGIERVQTMQGLSLRPLLEGTAEGHRPWIISEYSENEEAMIRTDRWKLVYITGNRTREDGYATREPTGRRAMLFDMEHDPGELHNVAPDPRNWRIARRLIAILAEHLRETARNSDAVPEADDPIAVLDFCLRPNDVR